MVRLTLAAVFALAIPGTVSPCSVFAIASPERLVREADLIVRARATGYATAAAPTPPPLGQPASMVQFTVLEVLPGARDAPVGLQIPGTLVEHDDFNDRPAPYDFVRPEGRGGNCYAQSYRSGGEFLLFLKKGKDGALTPYWAALAPVNEQLRPGRDPWLEAVREMAARVTRIAGQLK